MIYSGQQVQLNMAYIEGIFGQDAESTISQFGLDLNKVYTVAQVKEDWRPQHTNRCIQRHTRTGSSGYEYTEEPGSCNCPKRCVFLVIIKETGKIYAVDFFRAISDQN